MFEVDNLTDFENRLFEIANRIVGNVLNNGKETREHEANTLITKHINYEHFGFVTNQIDVIIPLWEQWFKSYCFCRRYTKTGELQNFTKYGDHDLYHPKLSIEWVTHPKIYFCEEGARITSRFRIDRFDFS